jgi:hypothetical protein
VTCMPIKVQQTTPELEGTPTPINALRWKLSQHSCLGTPKDAIEERIDDQTLDLPQVDHGGGRAQGREARSERRSREWSTCVACRNLNRIKNFGANNFEF